MARDFTLSIEAGFITHVKTRKLCRLTRNEAAPLRLLSLWAWAAEFAPDGDLSPIDVPEIEDGAGYHGEPGALFMALVEAGFIEEDENGGRRLHNWMKPGRTGYALKQAEAARARWRRAKGIPPKSNESDSVVTEDSARNEVGILEDSAVLHGSRFTVHGEDPPPPARACDPGAPEPRAPEPRVAITGPYLTQEYGRIRSELWPNALPWAGAPASPEKAANMAVSIDGTAVADIEPTMRLMLARVKSGEHRRAAEISRSPGFGFACWCQEFHELREAIHGRAPRAPPESRSRPGARAGPTYQPLKIAKSASPPPPREPP